jgi:CRISPR type III-B/RAMP module RAMP protein Cmr6
MIVAPEDTFKAWNSFDASQRARSLAATRFIIFRDDRTGDEWRRDSCLAIQKGAIVPDKLRAVRRFLARLPAARTHLVHARLMARLILNASGGTMENGGLCLDRNSGIPCVPGSAAKGCARRAAIAALQGAGAAEKVALLEKIALVLGWADTDWQAGRRQPKKGQQRGEFCSDLCFACADEQDDPIRPQCKTFLRLREEVASRLAARLSWTNRLDPKKDIWKQLPHFAGAVNFLSAFPLEQDPGIDLDVITCHHQKYYNAEPGYESVPDIEEPVPVVFPAVAAGGMAHLGALSGSIRIRERRSLCWCLVYRVVAAASAAPRALERP